MPDHVTLDDLDIAPDLELACALPEEMPAGIAETLAGFDIFRGVEPAAVEWFVANGRCVRYAVSAAVARPGDEVTSMGIIIEGSLRFFRETNKGYQDLGASVRGETYGKLPFSRMTHATGLVRADEETLLLELSEDCFTEMVTVSYSLVQNLVATMSDRIREYSDSRAQDEKMMSLGKLSAGLAHELNNPAAAVVRSADGLYEALHNTPESFKAIMLMQITPEEVDAINAVIFERLRRMSGGDERSTMDRLEASEALVDWLDGHELDGGDDDLLESLVAAHVAPEHLQAIYDICEGRSIGGLLAWFAKNIELELLTKEIREAASRISELVGSVKSYTHMDRAAGPQPLDVHEGLHSTLTMLKHKFKRKSVGLVKDFDKSLPPVTAWGGQINQVYTNLIDNAVDAAADAPSGENTGVVTVRTRCIDGGVCIEIEDNGPGIPEAYREEVFSPFFTTKPIGEGTGMGLDIVRKILAKHDSEPAIESAPGRTVVRFCLG